jgi:hypothetical protein
MGQTSLDPLDMSLLKCPNIFSAMKQKTNILHFQNSYFVNVEDKLSKLYMIAIYK